MADPMVFADKEEFLDRLRSLVRDGVPPERIRVHTPFPLPEVDEILPRKKSRVRFFALVGAASGIAAGFAFTILTSIEWGIIVGGKPVVSIPPFIIIAFELTILFGALSTFLGFLILSRLPSVRRIRSREEFGNAFAIVVAEGGPG